MQHAIGKGRVAGRRSAALFVATLTGPLGCHGGGAGLAISPIRVSSSEKPKEDWRDTHPEVWTDALACPTSMKFARRESAVPSPPDMAVVVFIRPSDARSETDILVVDDQAPGGGGARFLGQSQAASYFAATVPPGEHTFLGWANDAAGLRATLVAGRRYYVEVALDFGWPTHARLSAISPARKTWKKLSGWLAESTPQAPDERRGQACLTQSPRKLADWTGRAHAVLTHYDASDLAERTLRPEDGQ
jgi:hypothetical protein